jgi:aminopeptidase N
MAHPVRPESYIEINNFYTATVYNKGAEVIRMMHRLLGKDGFRKGMDLYFKRHDGQAVTCDDFVAAMEDANGADLGQFRLWYSQAGTPELDVTGHYDEAARTFDLTVAQHVPDTPGQTNKKPMHIPLAVGLLDETGDEMALKLDGVEGTATTQVLDVREAKQTFRFRDVPHKPVPSLLRDFSAPVRLKADLDDDALIFLMGHDGDPFNRWEAGQQLGVRLMLQMVERYRRQEKLSLEQGYVEALRKTLTDPSLDKAFIADVLSLPSEPYLGQNMEQIDVEAIHEVRSFVRGQIAHALKSEFEAAYRDNAIKGPYAFEPKSVGRRSLKNSALSYLAFGEPDATGEGSPVDLCLKQFRGADNMTDELGALSVLSHIDRPERAEAMAEFYDKWRKDALAVDKWFALQAMSERKGAIEDVKQLLSHPAYDRRNPNKVRALVGAFCFNNPTGFHDASGAGYEFLADRVLELDPMNPQVSARLAGALGRWRKYDPARQTLMKAALERIVASPNLSKDVYEIVSKSLV